MTDIKQDNGQQAVAPGKYVEMGYDLYTVAPDGTETLVHQSDIEDPERIVFGVTQGVIRPLEEAIEGKKAGETFDVKVTAEEGFGPVDPDQVVTLDREIFSVDGKFDAERIKVGAPVPMMTADGYRITGIVKEITDKDVTMDFNHPLAGKDLRFKGKVTLVRDATPEEIHPQQGGCCGCGGHDHDHDDEGGCCSGGGCGDGCCH